MNFLEVCLDICFSTCAVVFYGVMRQNYIKFMTKTEDPRETCDRISEEYWEKIYYYWVIFFSWVFTWPGWARNSTPVLSLICHWCELQEENIGFYPEF